MSDAYLVIIPNDKNILSDLNMLHTLAKLIPVSITTRNSNSSYYNLRFYEKSFIPDNATVSIQFGFEFYNTNAFWGITVTTDQGEAIDVNNTYHCVDKYIDCTFTLPKHVTGIVTVMLHYNTMHNNKEELSMEPETNSKAVVTTFEIPEALAKKLSDLLEKQSIREASLDRVIDDDNKYEMQEARLQKIINEVNIIKNAITSEYVPESYRTDAYVWNYDGYDIDGNVVSIYKA